MATRPENSPKHDPRELEGVKRRSPKSTGFPWLRVSFFILVCGMVIAMQGPLPQKIWRKFKSLQNKEQTRRPGPETPVKEQHTPPAKPETPRPEPALPPIVEPTDHTASSGGDIRRMSKGFKLETKVTVEKGNIASQERVKDESYTASYEIKIRLPAPSRTLAELKQVNPKLDTVLPGLKDLVANAEVSPFFYQLYENKVNRMKSNATRLNELMTRHNFFDCETMLNVKDAGTGRRALLIQAEMDVVSDGSDGDRLPTMPDNIVNSSHYQPMTSYGWRKRGTTPNPLIAGWKNRIQKAEEELAQAGTAPARKKWLRTRIAKIKREIQDMEARSYLIAEYDPFIVIPIDIIRKRSGAYTPRVGDYAVVIYGDKVYPSIVGDAGPSFKVGEASLRLAKQINPKAGPYSRPVSDLTVTYIVFPATADSFGPPDYSRWRERCAGLLGEIGGLGAGATLHTWENTLPVVETAEPDSP